MAKNDFIHNTINDFREKLDNALKGENAGAEILRAVQELLTEINAKYPQTAFRADMMADNTRKITKNYVASNQLPNAEAGNIPDGVQFMLKNITAHQQE